LDFALLNFVHYSVFNDRCTPEEPAAAQLGAEEKDTNRSRFQCQHFFIDIFSGFAQPASSFRAAK